MDMDSDDRIRRSIYMTKKENVKDSLKWLRLGCTVFYEVDGNERYAELSEDDKYIYIFSYGLGRHACKNTFKAWYKEFDTAKSFDTL